MQHGILKYEKYLLIFTLVDILFAPYVYFLATTYSQFIVFFWFVFKDKRFFNQNEVNFYYGIFGFILFSVLVSMVVLSPDRIAFYIIDSFKRGLNIGLAISYYFFFYYSFKVMKVRIEKWLFAFVLYVSLWGALFYLNTGLFLSLKVLFNPRDATISNLESIGYFMRYNFIWTDPNNVGYTLVGVVAYLIMNKRVSNIQIIIAVLCLLFSLLIIMSAGSIVTAAIVIPAAYLIKILNSRSIINFLGVAVSMAVMILLVQNYYTKFSESEIGKRATTRLEEKKDTGDSRPDIYRKLFESKNILYYAIAGEGTVLFVKGKPFSPHNGHLMFVFGYGLICYLLYFYIVFRKSVRQKWIDYIFISPFLLCFTLNIGIGELKYAAIMYMIVAISRTKSKNIKPVLLKKKQELSVALKVNESKIAIL